MSSSEDLIPNFNMGWTSWSAWALSLLPFGVLLSASLSLTTLSKTDLSHLACLKDTYHSDAPGPLLLLCVSSPSRM